MFANNKNELKVNEKIELEKIENLLKDFKQEKETLGEKIRLYCLDYIKDLKESGSGAFSLRLGMPKKNGQPTLEGILVEDMVSAIYGEMYQNESQHGKRGMKHLFYIEISKMQQKGFPIWKTRDFKGYVLASCKEELQIIVAYFKAPVKHKTAKQKKTEIAELQVEIAPTSKEVKGQSKIENVCLVEEATKHFIKRKKA